MLGVLLAIEAACGSAAAVSSDDGFDLTAPRVLDGQVWFEWVDRFEGELAFEIVRSPRSGASGENVLRRRVDAGTTSFIDRDVRASFRYFYRVEAVVEAGSGASSEEVVVTLPTPNRPPDRPELAALEFSETGVVVTWDDRSLNEDGFIILRREVRPNQVPSFELARVGYNTTTFIDETALRGRTYDYRVASFNEFSTAESTSRRISIAALGGEFSGHAMRFGEVYYFAYSGPDRIERYSIAEREWLDPIALSGAPTALWVDDDGIFVASGRQVFHIGGEGEPLFFEASRDVVGVFAVEGGFLVVFEDFGEHYTLRKTDRSIVNQSGPRRPSLGFAVADDGRTVYSRAARSSFLPIQKFTFAADGSIGGVEQGRGDYSGEFEPRVHVFPGGDRVASSSGAVFETTDMSVAGALVGTFEDLAFLDDGSLIVLREREVSTFSAGLHRQADLAFQSEGTALRAIAVGPDELLVVFSDVTVPRGLRVDVISLSQLSAPEPVEPPSPEGLAFSVADSFLDRDGLLYIYSAEVGALFRWDPVGRRYVDPLPLLGAPLYISYSPDLHRIYTAYPLGEIRKIELGTAGNPAEEPFTNMEPECIGLSAVGENLLAIVNADGGHVVFGPEGGFRSKRNGSGRSDEYTWNAQTERVYFFRDSISPNDLVYERIGGDGEISERGDSIYHGGNRTAYPIRVRPDGEVVALGSGDIYRTFPELEIVADLGRPIAGAVWLGEAMVSSELLPGGGGTQLRAWDSDYQEMGSVVLEGAPLEIHSLGGDHIVALTDIEGVPTVAIVDAGLGILYGGGTSRPPSFVAPPGGQVVAWGGDLSIGLAVGGTYPLKFEWFLDGDLVAVSDSGALRIDQARFFDGGEYTVRVSNDHGMAEASFEVSVGSLKNSPIAIGNALVTEGRTIHEITPDGERVRSWGVPHPQGALFYDVRDVVVGPLGRVFVYLDGSNANDYLSVFNAESETWEHWVHPAGSQFSPNGHLALIGHELFTAGGVTDLRTRERREFSLEDGGRGLGAGRDGGLYATDSEGVVELSRENGSIVRRIAERPGMSTVTADISGELFVAGREGEDKIVHLAADGGEIAQLGLGFLGANDLEVSAEGNLAISTILGGVLFGDRDLQSFAETSFTGSQPRFLTWVPPRLDFDTEPTKEHLVQHERFEYTVRFNHSGGELVPQITAVVPNWLQFEDLGDGRGILSGVPTEFGDTGVHEIALSATTPDGLRVEQRFDLTVESVNNPPVAGPFEALIVDEDGPAVSIELGEIFVDDEDEQLSFVIVPPTGGPQLPWEAEVAGQQLLVTPLPDLSGSGEIVVEATDSGGLAARGVLRVEIRPVPDRPVASPIPAIDAGAAATPKSVALAGFFSDVDPGDVLRFELVGTVDETLLSSASIDPTTGQLDLEFAPFVSGSTALTIRATDTFGGWVESEVSVLVPEIPTATVRSDGEVSLSRQTGLYEQRIVVTNTGERAVGSLLVKIGGLPEGVEVYNAGERAPDGLSATISYDLPVGAGEEVSIWVEYYSPSRTSFEAVELSVEHRLPQERPASDRGGGAITFERLSRLEDGAMLIEFRTRPGSRYGIQFSPDQSTWYDCQVPVRAGGTRLQWIDRGPPKTPVAPELERSRFYRLVELPRSEDP